MKKFESISMAEVAYENLENIYKVMMKQYKDLEDKICDVEIKNKDLVKTLWLQRDRILELETKINEMDKK